MSTVVSGMDPHKRSATVEVMASDEAVVGGGRYATDAVGYRSMLAEAKRWPERIWAIEGCQGIGRHIASRLLADGERVVDVPPKLSARARVFTSGQGRKTDATDAHSVALVATRMAGLRPVVADQLIPFANWVASLPASERPKTAAYPMVDDPFAVPMVQNAQAILQKAGVKTVYSKVFPAENPAYKAGADQVAHKKPDMVVIGSPDVPGVQSVMQAFMQQHFTPKILAASAGPDQGAAFLSAVGGPKNATGTMVPNGWYPGFNNPLSHAFVNAYIAAYGGTPADINADAAEAYSVGETLAAAVKTTNSLSNAKVISYLHSGVTLQTVQGPAKFNAIGENVVAAHFIFQWQTGAKFVQVLPTTATGSVAIVNPKPAWGKG